MTKGRHVILGSIFLFLVSSPWNGAHGQRLAPPSGQGVVSPPAAYFERLKEQPDFFTLRDGWIHKAGFNSLGAPPLSGTLPVVVALGLFADSPEPHITREQLQTALFDGPTPFGTVSSFYQEVSGGRLTLTGETLPWVRTSVTLAQAVGDSYGLGGTALTGSFLAQALAGVDENFDFGGFDNDGPDGVPNSGDDDGFVDAVAFQFLEVSASCGGPGIWPHRSRLQNWENQTAYLTDDPSSGGGLIQVNDYTIQSAVDCTGGDVQKATTMAHELGHVLGLPDLYDRSQGLLPEERRWVVGCWSLMAAGSWGCGTSNREAWVRPTHPGPWEKDVMGWLGNVEVVGEVLDQEFVLDPVQTSERVLKIPMEMDLPLSLSEYLLIEYRTQEGFDQDLPASGVLVYHVDPKIKTNRPCDTCAQEYMVELLEADGNNTLRMNFLQGGNRGEAGDAWGLVGSGALTNNTYPSTRLTSGASSGVTIYGISIQDGVARIRLSSVELPRARLGRSFLGSSGEGLSADEVQYLDSHGNQNGQYDVGDLRAYLKR
jgi:M6 family metalloprotease-like protein